MIALVAGATGATGRLLVSQLLDRGLTVRVAVRSPEKLPEAIRRHERVEVIPSSILDLSEEALAQHVQGCSAVASCLGHNISFKGIYGQPRMLVTGSVQKLCDAIRANAPDRPVRFVLMNTAGNANRDLHEAISVAERAAIFLIRALVPPHLDNERAADVLRTRIGIADSAIEWAAVRPDTLLDGDKVTPYALHASPTRSAIFNAGKTSRINVAHFMADLMTNDDLWNEWKGRMPVIYNRETS